MASRTVTVDVKVDATHFIAAMRRAARAAADFERQMHRTRQVLLAAFDDALKDYRHPPSPERLWIREYARAEQAEAQLWLERHLRNFEKEILG